VAYDINLATKTDRYGQSLPTEEFRQAWIAGGGKTPTQSPTVKSKPLSDELVTLWKMRAAPRGTSLGYLFVCTTLLCTPKISPLPNDPPPKKKKKDSDANSARISRKEQYRQMHINQLALKN
jgi:hypothetical protein